MGVTRMRHAKKHGRRAPVRSLGPPAISFQSRHHNLSRAVPVTCNRRRLAPPGAAWRRTPASHKLTKPLWFNHTRLAHTH